MVTNGTYPIGLRERWKSLSTLSTSLCSLHSLPSFTKEDLKSWELYNIRAPPSSCQLDSHFYKFQNYYITSHYSSQVLDDALATRKDDTIKAVDIQLGQVLHLGHSVTMAEASWLYHHVPTKQPDILINTTLWNCSSQLYEHTRLNKSLDLSMTLIHLKVKQCLQTSLPVLSRGRLLPHVVHHIHLLLVWSKHLEASTVTAQVVHGAEDRVVSYYLFLLGAKFLQWYKKFFMKSCDTHYTPSWTSVPSHQPHPENTWVTLWFTNYDNAPTVCLITFAGPEVICFTYHCNIGASPVAIITLVNKAGRLASENSQGLFWQQSPGCQHDLASISLC